MDSQAHPALGHIRSLPVFEPVSAPNLMSLTRKSSTGMQLMPWQKERGMSPRESQTLAGMSLKSQPGGQSSVSSQHPLELTGWTCQSAPATLRDDVPGVWLLPCPAPAVASIGGCIGRGRILCFSSYSFQYSSSLQIRTSHCGLGP